MFPHRSSDGTPCSGCGPECDSAGRPTVPAGLRHAITGCCAMQFPHGRFVFDAAGNCVQEATCCAGKECGNDAPENCSAHQPTKPEHVVEVRAPFIGGRWPHKKVQGILARLTVRAGAEAQGGTSGDRIWDARLTFKVDHKNTGEVAATVTALEKRINPHNHDPEWHHVAPSSDELARVRDALRLS